MSELSVSAEHFGLTESKPEHAETLDLKSSIENARHNYELSYGALEDYLTSVPDPEQPVNEQDLKKEFLNLTAKVNSDAKELCRLLIQKESLDESPAADKEENFHPADDHDQHIVYAGENEEIKALIRYIEASDPYGRSDSPEKDLNDLESARIAYEKAKANSHSAS